MRISTGKDQAAASRMDKQEGMVVPELDKDLTGARPLSTFAVSFPAG